MTVTARDAYGATIQALYPGTVQNVAIGVSSTQSGTFQVDTRVIRVIADQICFIAIGANPTASSSTTRLAANVAEYFAVRGNLDKLAVIQSTTAGSLNVTECAPFRWPNPS